MNDKKFVFHFKHDDVTQMGIDNINGLLDSFMGINDSELAEQVNMKHNSNFLNL